MTKEKITLRLENDESVREASITNWHDMAELHDWLCAAFEAVGYSVFSRVLREDGK
jgi:hypothetical protein